MRKKKIKLPIGTSQVPLSHMVQLGITMEIKLYY